MGDTIFDIFQSRADKFEVDLLSSFAVSKQTVLKLFDSFFASRGFSSKFKIVSIITSNFVSLAVSYSSFKLTRVFYLTSLAKLSELVVFESKLITAFQKKGISLLLYPLIFQTAKNNLSLLSSLSLSSSPEFTIVKSKVSILKSLS
jgi:hypothetical protein